MLWLNRSTRASTPAANTPLRLSDCGVVKATAAYYLGTVTRKVAWGEVPLYAGHPEVSIIHPSPRQHRRQGNHPVATDLPPHLWPPKRLQPRPRCCTLWALRRHASDNLPRWAHLWHLLPPSRP